MSTKEIPFIDWHVTMSSYDSIVKDSTSVYGMKLPEFVDVHDERVLNTLPPADFDDTGFVGRSKDLEKIKSLILGHYPVITVVGDGGVGKTALVLKAIGDLMDDSKFEYDAVIWVSLKTRTLNHGEFVNVTTAFKTASGIFDEVKDVLIGSSVAKGNDEDLIAEIVRYMSVFRVLLVLDNLETVNTESVRNFIEQIPTTSKLVITSRIGLGEFEIRHLLTGLEPKERVYYARSLANYYQLPQISSLSDARVDTICTRLHSNPLAIKWFVTSVLSGKPIEVVLQHTDELTEYCMSNVYDKLNPVAREVLNALLIYGKDASDAELAYESFHKVLDVRDSKSTTGAGIRLGLFRFHP